MKFMLALAAIPAAALSVVACSEAPAPEPEPTETAPAITPETVTDADCNADQFQDLIGTMLTDKKLYEIQQTNRDTRAYPEGEAGDSPDFVGTRLNLLLDQYRNILDVRCG